YSALPVKSNQKYLLHLIHEALRNDDLSIIRSKIEKQKQEEEILDIFDEWIDGENKKNNLTKEQAVSILEYIKRFLELIIKISISNESFHPAIEIDESRKNDYSFRKYMNMILSFDSQFTGFQEALHVLKSIQTILEENGKNVESRSEWIKCLFVESDGKTKEELVSYRFAECIVNLCYNYTVENSIYNISKHYQDTIESFRDDFFERLEIEWNYGRNSENLYLQEESNEFSWFIDKNQMPDWNLALRLLKKNKSRISNDDTENILVYENNYKENRKKQKCKNIMYLLRTSLISAVSVILIFMYFILDSLISGNIEGGINFIIKDSLLQLVLFFIWVTFAGFLVDKFLHISNVVDVLKDIYHSLCDIFHLFVWKSAAYVNIKGLLHKLHNKRDQKKELSFMKSDRILEYIKLWKTRRECFKGSQLVSIVEPNESNLKILEDYEIKHDVKLGVVYKSDFNIHVVDLIEKKNTKGKVIGYYPYERLLPVVKTGAVVVVTKCRGKFILLKQFRHSIQESQYCFVRGFGELNIAAEDNAMKELREEIGARGIREKKTIGCIAADSGIIGNKVTVVYVEIDSFSKGNMHEGIEEILLLNEEEMEKYIVNNKINDGFTLSAYMLYVKTFEKRVVKG
uniref:NUDIX hydrolase n=3 Tax=Amedibacterium intestinale TaxID=2583452 RepID=UPI000E545306